MLSTLQATTESVLDGDRRTLARVLTEVENRTPRSAELLASLYPHSGHSHIIGVTGAPGTGKSTLTACLIGAYRAQRQSIAVVAVDPSSPFSGGAILGDRVRMMAHAGDPRVFIRSMATRGRLGGLAAATSDAVQVMDAAGFDVIVIETVGAGQSEVEIASEAHTTLVVVVPGLGDDIQSIKAGIAEIADVFVVNKADHAHADQVVASLRTMLNLGGERAGWRAPIVKTVATRCDGAGELLEAVERHAAYLRSSGLWEEHERRRVALQLRRRLQDRLVAGWLSALPVGAFENMIDSVAERRIDPHSAVEELLAHAGREPKREHQVAGVDGPA
jgi:LAO/AO transport system kinase